MKFATALVGLMLFKYVTVASASAQKDFGRLESESSDRIASTIVRFFLSATPFCSGVFGIDD